MADYHLHPLTRLQTLVARNMRRAMNETAQATLFSECDVTALVKRLEDQLNGKRVRLSTYVIYALLQVLQRHPGLNAHLAADELCVYERVKLGLMLQAPQGVMVGCIPDADTLSLSDLERSVQDLYHRAQHGRLELSETRGATFMVADLSMFPVDHFTPVLLPSALAILGIGRTRLVCRPTPDGCRPSHMLSLSLTFDHRGTDGVATGRLLADLVQHLERQGSEA